MSAGMKGLESARDLLESRCKAIDLHYQRFPNSPDRTMEDTAQAIRLILSENESLREVDARLHVITSVKGKCPQCQNTMADCANAIAEITIDRATEAADRIATLEAEVVRLRDTLLGIAETDHYRRYPKQHEDGGCRGQSGLRAVRALTGKHGSYLNDDDVRANDAERRTSLGLDRTALAAGEG